MNAILIEIAGWIWVAILCGAGGMVIAGSFLKDHHACKRKKRDEQDRLMMAVYSGGEDTTGDSAV